MFQMPRPKLFKTAINIATSLISYALQYSVMYYVLGADQPVNGALVMR
jgi:hypothetical protein